MNISEKIRPLQDQTALVIHATTGIGAAIAEALANAGAKVMINYLDERDKADQLAEHIRNNQGQAMIFRADVNLENEVISMLDVLIVYWGRMDILINNAGLDEKTFDPLMSPESRHENISLNLAIQFLRVRQIARDLLEQRFNTQPSNAVGKIICVSKPDLYSREALAKLVDTLTQKLSEENVRVNGILAENCKPHKLNNMPAPEQEPVLCNFISDEKDCNAYAIAKMAVWLVSGEADSCKGETFNIGYETA